MSWRSDLGIERARMRRHTRHSIPREELFNVDGVCRSRSGYFRPIHSPDRDGRCCFCDMRVEWSRESSLESV